MPRIADALIVGTVSFDGLTPTVREIAARIPVIAAVNDIDSAGITAKAGVSWVDMGRAIGEYFATPHPKGRSPVTRRLVSGTGGRRLGAVRREGFRQAIAESSAEIVAVKWGDTGFEAQLLLLEEVLEDHPDIDYIIGSAVTADAAVSTPARRRPRARRSGVLADYFTHGTYRAIKRGKVVAAPTDSPVMQGKIAIDQAVRAIEGSLAIRHAGPHIFVVDADNIATLDIDGQPRAGLVQADVRGALRF